VGEWMPVTLFQNRGSKLVNITEQVGLGKTNGWWNCVVIDDLNEDGHIDLVAGNLGLNSKIQASATQPASIYTSDFDNNGLFEQILCYYKQGKSYPLPLRQDLVKRLPYLREKFPRHADYAGKQVTDIFTEGQLSGAVEKKTYTFATSVFYGNEDGRFRQQPLPIEAQFSPVYAIMARDFDHDGSKDLLLAGNFYSLSPQLGKYDASYGLLLSLQKGANGPMQTDGFAPTGFTPSDSSAAVGHLPLDSSYPTGFTSATIQNSGLYLTGQVRDMVSLTYRNKQEVIIFVKNDDQIQVYEITVK